MHFDLRMKMTQAEKWLATPKCPSLSGASNFLQEFVYWRNILAMGGQPQQEFSFQEKLKAAVKDVSELQAYYEKRLLQDVLAGDLGKKALVLNGTTERLGRKLEASLWFNRGFLAASSFRYCTSSTFKSLSFETSSISKGSNHCS